MNGSPFPLCFGLKPPTTLVVYPGGGFKQVDRPLTSTDIELIKVGF
jgi:hypothetical protein